MKKTREYLNIIQTQLEEVYQYELDNIEKAAELFAESIMNNGIIHVFGSGHSHTLSIELCHRAGGLVPIKAMDEAGRGLYEEIEGVGKRFMQHYDLRPNDVVLITSNSSRNPISMEIALASIEKGAKVITCHASKFSSQVTPKHKSKKKIYEVADLVIDNHCNYGDATVELEGLETLTGPTSTIVTATIYNMIVIKTIEILVEKGFTPPVLKSKNIDGGEEFNEKLIKKYEYRLFYKRYLKN